MANQRVQIGISFEYEKTGLLIPIPTGTPISIMDRNTSSPAVVYAGLTGTSTITSVISDSGGNVPGYVIQGSYRVTAAAQPAAVPPFPGATINFEAVRGDGVENYAPGSITQAALASSVQVGVPSGTILEFGGTNAPTGYLLCDGASYPTTGTTATLFGVLGYAYGGSGANFNVPDFRQRFAMGKAAAGSGSTLGAIGGLLNHTHSIPSLSIPALSIPQIFTAVTVPDHVHGLDANGGSQISSDFVDSNGFTINVNNAWSNHFAMEFGNKCVTAFQGIRNATVIPTNWINSQVLNVFYQGYALYGRTAGSGAFTATGATAASSTGGGGTGGGTSGTNDAANPPYLAVQKIIKL